MKTDKNRQKQTLTARQAGVLSLSLSGKTDTEIARTLRVSRDTINVYKKLPAFKRAYAEGVSEIVADSTSDLRKLSGQAVSILRMLMLFSRSEAIQLKASQTILEMNVRLKEIAINATDSTKLRPRVIVIRGLSMRK